MVLCGACQNMKLKKEKKKEFIRGNEGKVEINKGMKFTETCRKLEISCDIQ